MKKIISLILAVICIVSSASICANAKGWASNPEKIELNQDVSDALSLSDYCDILYYDCYLFSVPTKGTVTINLTMEDYYDSTAKIFNVNRTEEYEDELWEDWVKYDSASGNYVIRNQKVFLSAGNYYFLIKSGNGFGINFCTYAPYSFKLSYSCSVAKGSGIKCSARNTSAQKIAWNKVSGATGYLVQRSNNGGTAWSSYYSTSGNSYVFSGLTAGGKYKFRVRAYKTVAGTKYYGAWSSTLCSCCTPAKPTLRGVSSPKHTQIKTVWTKAGGTKSGYQILYGKNASFSSVAARKNVSSSYSSYTGKNFTKGRTYYVKVRTYTTFNGKAYYSAWSATKKVKCK